MGDVEGPETIAPHLTIDMPLNLYRVLLVCWAHMYERSQPFQSRPAYPDGPLTTGPFRPTAFIHVNPAVT